MKIIIGIFHKCSYVVPFTKAVRRRANRALPHKDGTRRVKLRAMSITVNIREVKFSEGKFKHRPGSIKQNNIKHSYQKMKEILI